MSPSRRTRVLALVVLLSGPVVARAQVPADSLLALTPPDAALTIAVEGLRQHTRAFQGSAIRDRLLALPSVRGWLASGRFQGLRKATSQVESILGIKLVEIRDRLLGDAVVLALRVPPGGRVEDARGLLLVKADDPGLLVRLIDGVNASQQKGGELKRLVDRKQGSRTYHVREFADASRPAEAYVILDAGVFAWSNSEGEIRDVILRGDADAPGLNSAPGLLDVRKGLPTHALASVYVSPRFVELLISSSPRSEKPDDEKLLALIRHYLAAVRHAGAALEWRDGLLLHTEQSVDPAKLPARLRDAFVRSRPVGADATRISIPANALAMASIDIDLRLALDAVQALVSGNDRDRIETLKLAVNGLLLGRNFRDEVLTHIEPGVVAYVESPEVEQRPGRLPFVLSLKFGPGADGDLASRAVDNALRTVLAFSSLEEKGGKSDNRLDAREEDGTVITSTRRGSPFAYAIRDRRLVLATTAGAVSRALAAPGPFPMLERVRKAYFPEAATFALADLKAIHRLADRHRDALARQTAARQGRPLAEATRDLDQVLALTSLFDGAFSSIRVDRELTSVHFTLGLVAPTFP